MARPRPKKSQSKGQCNLPQFLPPTLPFKQSFTLCEALFRSKSCPCPDFREMFSNIWGGLTFEDFFAKFGAPGGLRSASICC